MDKIDQKIMKYLDSDPRIPLTTLAKKARISQQVVDYRIRRLLKEKRISKFGAIINLKALGQEQYRLFFTLNSKHSYSNEEIFDYLKKRKGVYWTALTGGKYDLHVTLFVFDFEELDNFIDEFNQQFPGMIKDYKGCYVLEHAIYGHKYLNSTKETIKYGYNDEIEKIDSLDHQILNKLKDNCRIPALELAKGKNVTYKTIINRIKSLEKKKVVLGYRVFITSEEEKPFLLLLSFQDYSKDQERKLLFHLEGHKNITQSLRMFGIWNLLVHVRAKDIEHLQQLLRELRDRFSIIDNFEIVPVFKDISINLYPI